MHPSPSAGRPMSWMVGAVLLAVLAGSGAQAAQPAPQVAQPAPQIAQPAPQVAQSAPSVAPAAGLADPAAPSVAAPGVAPAAPVRVRPALARRAAPSLARGPVTTPPSSFAKIDEGGAGQAISLTTTKVRQLTMPVDVRDVVLADPTVADVLIKTPRLIYLVGNKVGDTNAVFLDAAGRQVLKLDIRVDRDLAALRSALRQLVPGTDIKVAALGSDLVMSGDVPSAVSAEQARQLARRFVEKDESLVNMMKITGSQQVVIRVKVAELERKVTKQLGVDFLSNHGVDYLARGNTRATLGTGGARNITTSASLAVNAAGIFSKPFAVGKILFGGFLTTIEALEQNQLLKILAEPNLTALSGEPANFLAGGEFPAASGVDSNGNPTITYKSFGVSLAFTPVVLANGRISLRISTEVSELTDEGSITVGTWVMPGLAVRRAQTTVEIPSGGSLMLGGLLRNDVANKAQGVPGLKDIPVLGALFRSNDFLRGETELVVIATPYIVRPTDPAGLAAPTDGFAPASDLDMYFMNGLYARYGAGKPPEMPGRFGGYIVR